MSALSHSLYVDSYREPATHEPAWLSRLRRQALTRFEASGFPSPRDEEWRYTHVAPIERKLFTAATGPADIATANSLIEGCRIADAWSLVFVDGMFAPELSERNGLPAGVMLENLASLLQTLALSEAEGNAGWLEAGLELETESDRHGFLDFNTAFFTDGAVLRVDEGVMLEKPIQLFFVSTRDEGRATLRNLIRIGRHAEARIVETHVGAAATGYLGAVVNQIEIGDNGGLNHYKLQLDGGRAYHFGGSYAHLARDGRFGHHSLSLGGLLVRNEVHARLARAARTEMNGLFLSENRQHVDNHVRVDHDEPHGSSRVTYRGILKDRSRGVFQGRIVVHPDAQKTDAEMNNRNLLLSDDAEIDTKPQLEIHADDVKCGHGVTIGQLDPDSVFYLESRGIDAATAREMLTFAFAAEIVERIAVSPALSGVEAGVERPDPFHELLRGMLLARFPNAK
ncbi:Fe-S cluster assembly protein SufD [Methylococcus geothermalis]|uniref:Fe-S cluster assembly protein SufD n=1 Tax=Methylococcus geothermalis TaxID=2681310 RepID=A0A858Q850_9GAMM|nr:Fe-S cluster assembly protein SufD [Methylococcus geothermalis]QJD30029.1 Fe-S cluster assembly protein SufD [Methylococcus geothermalis]